MKGLAEEKLVIIVMGVECSSGGYYVASFAKVYTRENTLTGRVDVISVWVNLSENYKHE